MTMSCPEVMYQAYYPYLYQRASTGAAVPRPTFPSPFTHQYDRLNVQRSFQDHVHSNLTSANLSTDASSSYITHHGHSQQSSAGSVASSGPCNSPGSPTVRHKEENIRSSTEGDTIEDGATDDEGSSSSRAQYVSANCVVFTHYTGDVAAVVDEHFSRALSYSEKSSSGSKDSSPMSSRNFPPSFWNSNYQSPTVSMSHHGELYSEYQHAGADPWHTHYQQYTAAAHHHRAVHDYHHHHNTVAQYSGLLLPRASLAPQYGKDAWTSSHTTRLHESAHAHSHSHFESSYSTYPSMSATAELNKDVVRGPGMGRITGSASIETLVRVGIEKENGLSPDSKMVILHDFTPCVDDELEVKRGQVVNILYRENDWVYVIAQDTRQEGFIPHSYCTPFTSYQHLMELKKKLPHEPDSDGEEYGQLNSNNNNTINTSNNNCHNNNNSSNNNSNNNVINSNNNNGNHSNSGSSNTLNKKSTVVQLNLTSSQASLQSAGSSSQPEIHPFSKDPSGRYIVLYTFIARDENDVSVERGEFVTVLNREDPDWFWIVRSDGQEGFVPSGFVYPADVIQGHITENANASAGASGGSHVNYANGSYIGQQTTEEMKYHGTELVMLYDYKAQAPDDLSVRRGDWIYADLNNQTVDGWLWAYAPKTRKYGFIPKAYARPPAMTSL